MSRKITNKSQCIAFLLMHTIHTLIVYNWIGCETSKASFSSKKCETCSEWSINLLESIKTDGNSIDIASDMLSIARSLFLRLSQSDICQTLALNAIIFSFFVMFCFLANLCKTCSFFAFFADFALSLITLFVWSLEFVLVSHSASVQSCSSYFANQCDHFHFCVDVILVAVLRYDFIVRWVRWLCRRSQFVWASWTVWFDAMLISFACSLPFDLIVILVNRIDLIDGFPRLC